MLTIAPAQMHSPTSIDAAQQIEPHMPRLRAEVLGVCRVSGPHGATDEEMQMALVMPANTQRPRRVELWKMGLICDSGQKRKTRSGRNAVVWVAT